MSFDKFINNSNEISATIEKSLSIDIHHKNHYGKQCLVNHSSETMFKVISDF